MGSNEDNPILRAALEYLARGFSVIPVGPTKRPLIKWDEFQVRRPTAEEVRAWWEQFPTANVGIVTGKLSGLTVIDCDSREGIDTVTKMAGANFLAPTVETSRGIQYYCRFDPLAINRHTVARDVDIRSEGGFVVAPPSVHSSGKVYAWVDPFTLDMVPLPFVPAPLLTGASLPASSSPPLEKREGSITTAFTKGRRHDSILHVIKCAAEGGLERDWLVDLGRRLAGLCDPPYSERQLQEEIAGMVEWSASRGKTSSQEIREWILQTTGIFSTTDLYRGLQLTSREAQKTATVILGRLKEEGIIEKYGKRNGVYRLVHRDIVTMDWKAAEISTFDIDWPLGIGDFFVTYPKNICVFAGFKDSGKTTLAIDLIKRNMKKHKIRYVNCEMSAEELKMRISKHTDLNIEDWDFEAIERTDDFPAVIMPNGITIIDYIEPGEEVYKIGTTLRQIHEKLDRGIAIVILQKKKRQSLKTGGMAGELGYGAEFTLMRPRLYITLDPGVARVVSAKNRAEGVEHSPVGKLMPYKIVQGAKLIPSSAEWLSEEAYQEYLNNCARRPLFGSHGAQSRFS